MPAPAYVSDLSVTRCSHQRVSFLRLKINVDQGFCCSGGSYERTLDLGLADAFGFYVSTLTLLRRSFLSQLL